jgi:hypothetical protein
MPLTIICPACDDGWRWTSRYGGNDPDVWRAGPCLTCEGDQEITLCCDTCDDDAEEWFQGHKFCASCCVEQKTDVLEMREDAP